MTAASRRWGRGSGRAHAALPEHTPHPDDALTASLLQGCWPHQGRTPGSGHFRRRGAQQGAGAARSGCPEWVPGVGARSGCPHAAAMVPTSRHNSRTWSTSTLVGALTAVTCKPRVQARLALSSSPLGLSGTRGLGRSGYCSRFPGDGQTLEEVECWPGTLTEAPVGPGPLPRVPEAPSALYPAPPAATLPNGGGGGGAP